MSFGGNPYPVRTSRTQVIRRVRCPVCGSTDVETYSTRAGEDGRRIRYCRCRDCRDLVTREPTRFKVVMV